MVMAPTRQRACTVRRQHCLIRTSSRVEHGYVRRYWTGCVFLEGACAPWNGFDGRCLDDVCPFLHNVYSIRIRCGSLFPAWAVCP